MIDAFFTSGEIADAFKQPRTRVAYVIRRYRIREAGKCGNIRFFGLDEVKIIEQKIKEEPLNPLWQQFMGDLQAGRKLYGEAVAAYERNLALAPDNPEVLNNLAWLLLTAKEKKFLDPVRALKLSQAAIDLQPRGYMLDTLAEAYWANGMIDEAVQAAEEAIAMDRAQRAYYRQQTDKRGYCQCHKDFST